MNESNRMNNHDVMSLTLPAPFQFESPSSWLTRAALTQGVSPAELGRYLGYGNMEKFELNVNKQLIQKIVSKSNLVPVHFEFMRVMFANLCFVDEHGRNLLLFSDAVTARYRYCAVCLHEQSVKHFPVHWRFKTWRYCPLHACLMEDYCRRCGSPIILPTDLVNAGPEKEGVAYLHQCLRCGKSLCSHWSKAKGELYRLPLSTKEKTLLSLGRAVLSGLYALEDCREKLLREWFEIYFLREIEVKAGLDPMFELSSKKLYEQWHRREKNIAYEVQCLRTSFGR
jgi:hypothetical protein